MKYQCVHSDTGLCDSCFKYESRIASLEQVVRECIKALENHFYKNVHGKHCPDTCLDLLEALKHSQEVLGEKGES